MSARRRSADVVIVGAGITGSILAALLANQGLRVAVLEQRHQRPRGGSFAGVVMQRDLDTLGIGHPPADLLHPLETLTRFDLENSDAPVTEEVAGAFSIQHDDLLAWLRSRALDGGIRFERAATVTSLRWKDGAVAGVTVHDEAQWDASVVVIADESDPRLAEEPGMRPDWNPSQLIHIAKQRFDTPIGMRPADHPFSVAAVYTGRATWGRAGFGTLIACGGPSTLTGAMLLEDEMASGRHIGEFLDEVRRHPRIASAIEAIDPSAEVTEVIPIGGIVDPCRLTGDGVLVLGDMIGLTHPVNRDGLSANADVTKLAARTIIEAGRSGDYSSIALARFDERVRELVVDPLRRQALAASLPADVAWALSTRCPPLAGIAHGWSEEESSPTDRRGASQRPVSLRRRMAEIGHRVRHRTRP